MPPSFPLETERNSLRGHVGARMIDTKILNICGLVCGFFAALLLIKPWTPIFLKARLAQAESQRRAALRALEQLGNRFEKVNQSGGFLQSSRLWAHFASQKIGSAAMDAMHSKFRQTMGLPPMALQVHPGLLDEASINLSYDEISRKIRSDYENGTPRDLSTGALWLLLAGFSLQLLAAIFS